LSTATVGVAGACGACCGAWVVVFVEFAGVDEVVAGLLVVALGVLDPAE
jgi:hypothetical protein